MTTTARPVSAEQLLAMQDEYRYELVRGELRKMNPAGFRHGRITMNLSSPLHRFVVTHGLGAVCTAETGFQLAEDHVRAPDIGFISRARLEEVGDPEGYWPGPPDMAIEVISPNDRFSVVEEKVFDWLQAGTKAVLLVSPENVTVTLYRSTSEIRVMEKTDTLEIEDVIPGWRLTLEDVF